ncbi:MAG TPA: Ig-like domain-containing protein, partial [Planctomycetota bacterium]|nr:Ig-like domain-containing protein [Planctomycetota bacterium]
NILAVDAVDGVLRAVCFPPPGFTFSFGTTTVICTAVDAAGNTGSASFEVQVVDTTPPIVTAEEIFVHATENGGAWVALAPHVFDFVDLSPVLEFSPDTRWFPIGVTEMEVFATDFSGNTASARFTVTVTNEPPTTGYDSYTIAEDLTLTVDAANGVLRNDSDADGDGLIAALGVPPSHGSVILNTDGSFNYTPNGNFYGFDGFSYYAVDVAGDRAEGWVTITVNPVNDAPVAKHDNFYGIEDEPVSGKVMDNDYDADGDAIAASLTLKPKFGIVTLERDGSFVYTPAPNFYGGDFFAYTVSDGWERSAETIVELYLKGVDDPPTFNGVLQDQAFLENTFVKFRIDISGFSDADGDAFQFSAPNLPEWLTFDDVNFVFSGMPPQDYVGSTTIEVVATSGPFKPNEAEKREVAPAAPAEPIDPKEETPKVPGETKSVASVSAFFTLTILNANEPPVAGDLEFNTDEDASLIVDAPGVLAGASDADGDALSAILKAMPRHGSVGLLNDGSFVYTPEPDFFGSDSFTFTVFDGEEESNTATVFVSVAAVNDAPVAREFEFMLDEDNALIVPAPGLLAGASDIDGDALSAVLAASAAHGMVVLNSDGSLTYTPDRDFCGDDFITYEVLDGRSSSGEMRVQLIVLPVNDAPVAHAQTVTLIEDTPVDIVLSGFDVDGDPLTYEILTQPTLGTLETGALPVVRYIPAPDDTDSHAFSFRVIDSAGVASAPAWVKLSITPVNDPPQAAPQNVATDEDTPLKVKLVATDIDNAALSYAVVDGPAHGTLSGSGADLIYTPHANYFGTDSFSFLANDGARDSAPAAVFIKVRAVNDTPVANGQSLQFPEDQLVSLTLSGSDIEDGSNLSFLLSADPNGGSVQLNGSVATFTPPLKSVGTFSFAFVAVDSAGARSEPATVSISFGNQPPVLSAISVSTALAPVGTMVYGSATFTDAGLLDTHTAVWNWDDSMSTAGIIESANGASTVQGSHIFTAPGVYSVTLTLTDKDGGSAVKTFDYVVIYDPSGGFVTGSGSFTSPAGAYAADLSATGKATFGFTSRYQKGANVPTGSTSFQFNAGNLQFESTSYEWLVVAGANAKYKGSGKVNGAGDYGFMLTCTDGSGGNGGSDKIRIKIWDKASGAVLYDNKAGTSDDEMQAGTAIERGNIVIHK